MTLPVIDMAPLFTAAAPASATVAAAIARACEDDGFFYVTGHGIAPATLTRLDTAARAFFALPEPDKAAIAMDRGGAAWRGWFPFRGELTSGPARRPRRASISARSWARPIRASPPKLAPARGQPVARKPPPPCAARGERLHGRGGPCG